MKAEIFVIYYKPEDGHLVNSVKEELTRIGLTYIWINQLRNVNRMCGTIEEYKCHNI
jgi:hypothetical protein